MMFKHMFNAYQILSLFSDLWNESAVIAHINDMTYGISYGRWEEFYEAHFRDPLSPFFVQNMSKVSFNKSVEIER